MASVTAQQVKLLRDQIGSGMMDSKRALEATSGDLEKAKDWLRQKGMAKAGMKSVRAAREGVVEIYLHHNHQLGVLLELNTETDFVARTEAFRELAHEIALHIAAANPRYLTRDEVPSATVEGRREAIRVQAVAQKKPAAIIEKIVDGKLRELFKREVLLEQPWAKDDSRTVEEVLKEAIASFGENVSIARFARFKVREDEEANGRD